MALYLKTDGGQMKGGSTLEEIILPVMLQTYDHQLTC